MAVCICYLATTDNKAYITTMNLIHYTPGTEHLTPTLTRDSMIHYTLNSAHETVVKSAC